MSELNEMDTVLLYSASLYWIVMVFVLIRSYKIGKFREVFENLFLGLLLYTGIYQIWWPPIEFEDKVVSGVFFIAFGLCRLAKSIAQNDCKK